MPIHRARRVVLLALAVVITVVIVVVSVVAVLSGPRFPGPLQVELGDELFDDLRMREAEDQLLRERLGGLAALVTDDESVARCTRGPLSTLDPPESAEPVDAVLAVTEQIRELSLDEPVDVRLLDDAEMTERVSELFAGQWSDNRVDVEQRKLTALGAVEPGTDLFALRVDAFAQQVSGYFSGGQQEIGLRTADPADLSPLERVVLAHEFEHALTAQNLGRASVDSTDAGRARSAVVEGSAVLAMMMYADKALSEAERAHLRQELLARARADALADYSPYLRAELQFPYVQGVRYVCERWLDGGWEAVDALYEDPPASTAEMMFPERDGEPPRQPFGMGEPKQGWDRVREVDFGAAQLHWLLAAPGGDRRAALDEPQERAGAWDGGELVVWSQHEVSAVGLALVDRGAGRPLCESVRLWYEAAFPQVQVTPAASGEGATFVDADQHAALTCEGDQVRLGIAPLAEVAAAIAG